MITLEALTTNTLTGLEHWQEYFFLHQDEGCNTFTAELEIDGEAYLSADVHIHAHVSANTAGPFDENDSAVHYTYIDISNITSKDSRGAELVLSAAIADEFIKQIKQHIN